MYVLCDTKSIIHFSVFILSKTTSYHIHMMGQTMYLYSIYGRCRHHLFSKRVHRCGNQFDPQSSTYKNKQTETRTKSHTANIASRGCSCQAARYDRSCHLVVVSFGIHLLIWRPRQTATLCTYI